MGGGGAIIHMHKISKSVETMSSLLEVTTWKKVKGHSLAVWLGLLKSCNRV